MSDTTLFYTPIHVWLGNFITAEQVTEFNYVKQIKGVHQRFLYPCVRVLKAYTSAFYTRTHVRDAMVFNSFTALNSKRFAKCLRTRAALPRPCYSGLVCLLIIGLAAVLFAFKMLMSMRFWGWRGY